MGGGGGRVVGGTGRDLRGKHGTHQIIIDIIYFFNIGFGLNKSKEKKG